MMQVMDISAPSSGLAHRPPEASAVELAISGMTCAACATRIEKVLNRLPEVRAVVNFATERASIEYAPDAVDLEKLIETVRKAGYDAHEPLQSQKEDELVEAAARTDLRHFIIGQIELIDNAGINSHAPTRHAPGI